MKRHVFAAVIGGGAAGLICALRAAERHPGQPVVILERADRVGKKLLVTGNGRCNLSHLNATAASYHGEGSSALINILFQNYNTDAVLRYFGSLGLLTEADAEGRVYPRTNLASSVLDVLRLHLKRLGVEELCGAAVTDVRRRNGQYEIVTQDGLLEAEKLVVAAGGRTDYAGRDSGSADILRLLGLRTTKLSPSLSPVRVKGDILRPLKGIRADAEASLISGGRIIKSERGEVQFTENALSGICIFNLSREANRGGCEIALNLLPDLSRGDLARELKARLTRYSESPVSDIFVGMFHKNIGMFLLKACGISPSTECRNISDKEINTLCGKIADCRFTCEASSDFRKAQVTAGGICLSEIDSATFESKAHPGLYLIGEALDVDGDCGGYNLQFAWASGMCAGDSL